MALNPKQQRFCEEYVVDLNGTQAAIRAGYSPKTANEQAARLLAKASIQEEVEKLQKKHREEIKIDRKWIIERLVENVNRSMQIIPVLDKDGDPTGEFRYEGNVANKALELLGRHDGMFSNKVELTGKDGEAIKHEHEHKHAIKAYFDSLEADVEESEKD